MGENFGDRLRYFIERQLFMNIKEFEKKCNFSTGTIHRAIKNGSNIGVDKLEVIAKIHPELNIDWLLTGEGAMIDGNHTLSDNKNLEVNANINYKDNSDLITKLSSALLSLTENNKIRAENERIQAQALYKITETNQVLATNESNHLEIQKQLVVLLEKK